MYVGKGVWSPYTFAAVRADGRMDRRADKWKGDAVARVLGRVKDSPGVGGGHAGRRGYGEIIFPRACLFFARLTNEVNRNRTKLILLSVEKSHRPSIRPPPPAIFPPSAERRCDATRRDATRVRVCVHFYTHTHSRRTARASVRRFRRW